MPPFVQIGDHVKRLAIAEFERSIIQERVSAGLRAARAKGVKLGRPSTLDEHEPAVRVLIGQGAGVREIARRLKLPVGSAFKLIRKVQTPPQR